MIITSIFEAVAGSKITIRLALKYKVLHRAAISI